MAMAVARKRMGACCSSPSPPNPTHHGYGRGQEEDGRLLLIS